MNEYTIAYIIVYNDGETEHGVNSFNNKAAARTYERFLQEHLDIKSVMIYNGEEQ